MITDNLPEKSEGVHVYANGVRCWERTINKGALARCQRHVNLHEPLQEVIFKSLIQRPDVRSYINLGTGWGYYLLLARQLRPDLEITGVEGNRHMLKRTRDNLALNEVEDVRLLHAWVSSDQHPEAISLDALRGRHTLPQACVLSVDIDGDAASMLKGALESLTMVSELLIGTHEKEHAECLEMLESDASWVIRLAVEAQEIPLQPDGLIWASRLDSSRRLPWVGCSHLEPGAVKAESPLKTIVAVNKYGSYCIPTELKNRSEAKAILEGGVWEPETVEFLRTHAGMGDVVHAGTFFGDMLPALSEVCPGIVWAFEPNELNHQAAAQTLRINGLKNVQLLHAALGARAGHTLLMVRDAGGNLLAGRSRRPEGTMQRFDMTEFVTMLTLDQVIPTSRRVALIHLDVEGAELEVLKGAEETIRRELPTLVLEHPPKDPWFVENVVNALGYEEVGRLNGNSLLQSVLKHADIPSDG